jgi:hypothetical protein
MRSASSWPISVFGSQQISTRERARQQRRQIKAQKKSNKHTKAIKITFKIHCNFKVNSHRRRRQKVNMIFFKVVSLDDDDDEFFDTYPRAKDPLYFAPSRRAVSQYQRSIVNMQRFLDTL